MFVIPDDLRYCLECEVIPKHLIDHRTDHEGVNLKIRWTIGGLPDDVRPPWKFRNYLLELPSFCKEMKSGIRETLIKKLLVAHSDQIPLTRKDFRLITTEKLECTLIKASSRMQDESKIDPLDTIYECFKSIKTKQQLKEGKDRSNENRLRLQLTKELDKLKKIIKHNRATKRLLINLRCKLEDLATELRRKRTIDFNISWAHLGETGSTFFFRSAQAKRQKLWVRSLEIPNDTKNKTKNSN